MKNLWKNNNIQFARLLTEIEQCEGFTPLLIANLSESMDLSKEEIFEIIDRAKEKFENIKEAIK